MRNNGLRCVQYRQRHGRGSKWLRAYTEHVTKKIDKMSGERIMCFKQEIPQHMLLKSHDLFTTHAVEKS